MKNLVFLLSLILLLCGGCKYFKKQNPKSVEVITADTSESENSSDSTAYYSSLPEQPAAATETQQGMTTGNAVAGKYYMIVGCFKVDANADAYAEKIRSMGYNVELLRGANDFEMVAARSYNSYRESVSEIEKFRTEVTPNAWVYLER